MSKVYVLTIIKSVRVFLKSLCFLNASCVSPQIIMDADPQLKVGFIGAGNMAFGIAKGLLPGEGRMVLRHRSGVWVKASDECLLFVVGNVLPENVKVSAPSSRHLERFQVLFNISCFICWDENGKKIHFYLYSQWDLPD